MAALEISVACCAYDRTRAVFDGRAPIAGCRVLATPIEPEEAFHRAFKFQEFDVTELSLSSYAMMVSRNDSAYIAIPAFVSRLFRHSGIYIRTDRGINSPADLRGKTIGLPEYQITANVWIRGILQDEYGVAPADIHWRQGGLEEPGRTERAPLLLPPEIDLKPIRADHSLSQLLEQGELDGVIGARAPSCFLRGAPNVARLFPNYRATEVAYYIRTGIFPIMHVIGIRRSLVDRHPWLPVNVYKAFIEAKRMCMEELAQIGHLYCSLPWSVSERDVTMTLMGEDFWSYGLEPNEKVLGAFLRYHHQQGISARLVRSHELFATTALELSRI